MSSASLGEAPNTKENARGYVCSMFFRFFSFGIACNTLMYIAKEIKNQIFNSSISQMDLVSHIYPTGI